MRLPDRLDHGADAEGQRRGLRGRDPSRPRRLALIGGALAALASLWAVLVVPAQAHSLLVESSPAVNSTLSASPPAVVLRFNNRIEKKLSRIRLAGASGQKLDLPVEVAGRADILRASVPSLDPGLWRVEWQVLSTDGHVVKGVFSFRFDPTGTEASGQGAAVPSGRGGGQPR